MRSWARCWARSVASFCTLAMLVDNSLLTPRAESRVLPRDFAPSKKPNWSDIIHQCSFMSRAIMVATMKPADATKICSMRFSRALIPAYRSAQTASWADSAASFLSIRSVMAKSQ